MADLNAVIDAAVRALRDLSADPVNADLHVKVFYSIAPFPPEAKSRLLDRWAGCFASGRSRSSVVDRLAELFGGHAHRVAILRLAARQMVEAGWGEEAVRAFHHSCAPLGPAAIDASLLRDKFAALSDVYDESYWSGETARQFCGFLDDSISFSPEWTALDAGCGTGLVGEWLAPRVTGLDGIDLSPDMLIQARAKDIYESLAEGDVLLVEADQSSLQEFINETHLGMAAERHIGSDNLASEDVELVEAVIMPGSRMEGLTPEEMHLHSRYGINVLALARRGATMCARIGQVRLQIGDVLLVQGEAIAMTETLSRLGSLPVSGDRIASRQASIWPMAIFAFVLLASGLGFIPIHIALVAGAALIVAARFLPLRRVYESIDWSVIVLLAAMVPVGKSLETTKTTGLLADAVLAALQNMAPEIMLGAIIVIAMALSNVINNAATAILMAPLALQIASGLGYGPDPFLMAIAIGSSCAFVTPIGHQSNLLVMGPGGYRFGDYWRIGGAVSVAAVLVAVPLILLVWPLKPA